MRFDKETRAKVQEAAPGSTTIHWPVGQRQPEKNRTYRMQSAEEVEKAAQRLEESPPRNRDVMAAMHSRRYGKWPEGYKPPRPKLRRPSSEDDCILVLDVMVADGGGWEAVVALFEEADPVRHTGLKTKVKGGSSTLFLGEDREPAVESTEMEPEKILVPLSRSEREAQDDLLKFEHQASVDQKKIAEKARKVQELRSKGKRSTLAEAALERTKKRAALNAADVAV
jgi:hypothetical protein